MFKPATFGLKTQTFNPEDRPNELNVNPTFANVNILFQTSLMRKCPSFMLNLPLCEGLAQTPSPAPHSPDWQRLASLKGMRAETLDC